MKKEEWLNIYNYDGYYVRGTDLYLSPAKATKNLADKQHYMHTINVVTGEIKVMKVN